MSEQTLSELISSSFRPYYEGSIVKGRILEIKNRRSSSWTSATSPKGAIPVQRIRGRRHPSRRRNRSPPRTPRNDEGMVVLSKEKAAHKQNWEKIAKVFHDGGLVRGKVKAVVKGGLTVNVGVEAFLPGSQIDIIPPRISTNTSARFTNSRSSRSTTTARTSSSAAAKSSKPNAPNSARSSSKASSQATRSGRKSRTSPTSVCSSTSTAWTVCCTSPTCRGAASTILPKWSPSVRTSKFRSSK